MALLAVCRRARPPRNSAAPALVAEPEECVVWSLVALEAMVGACSTLVESQFPPHIDKWLAHAADPPVGVRRTERLPVPVTRTDQNPIPRKYGASPVSNTRNLSNVGVPIVALPASYATSPADGVNVAVSMITPITVIICPDVTDKLVTVALVVPDACPLALNAIPTTQPSHMRHDPQCRPALRSAQSHSCA